MQYIGFRKSSFTSTPYQKPIQSDNRVLDRISLYTCVICYLSTDFYPSSGFVNILTCSLEQAGVEVRRKANLFCRPGEKCVQCLHSATYRDVRASGLDARARKRSTHSTRTGSTVGVGGAAELNALVQAQRKAAAGAADLQIHIW